MLERQRPAARAAPAARAPRAAPTSHTRSSPSGRGQRVGEHQRALLGQVDRRLQHPAAVVEAAARRAARRRGAPARARSSGCRRASTGRPERAAPYQRTNRSTSRTWSGLSTTTASGANASMRSHRSRADGRRRERVEQERAPPDATATLVTAGSQSDLPVPVGVRLAPQPQSVDHVMNLHWWLVHERRGIRPGREAPSHRVVDHRHGDARPERTDRARGHAVRRHRPVQGHLAHRSFDLADAARRRQPRGRAVLSTSCGGWAAYNMVVRSPGARPTASPSPPPAGRRSAARSARAGVALGHARSRQRHRHGAVAPRCRSLSCTLAMRTSAAPAGAAAVPAPGTLMHGLLEPVGGRHGAAGHAAGDQGRPRVRRGWQALAKCRRAGHPAFDFTPSRKIAADGTFGGTQSYTIRYKGFSERYRVSFRGRFTADGASGTFTATMRYQDGQKPLCPCRSGRQTWTARG